jgi:nucleoside-diphosphate-sugar epimerase
LTGPRLLVTGAAGFVGSALVAALGQDVPLRLLAHRRPVGAPLTAEVVHADLTQPGTLDGCCDGIDVVVHLASEVGRDEARCQAVNVRGTEHLLAQAARSGVRDVIYVSTAAVHGRGPHHDLHDSGPAAPVSAASRSRRRAEELVLTAGGVVLRPFFTYGAGDRWFVPTLLRWLHTWPRIMLDGGSARQSVVAVEDLAAVIAAAATRPAAFGGSPFHVCEPLPVRTSDALATLAELFRLPPPRLSLPAAAALGTLRLCRLRALERRLELLGVEHTYHSERAWQIAGVTPGPGMLERLSRYAGWYAGFARPAAARGIGR